MSERSQRCLALSVLGLAVACASGPSRQKVQEDMLVTARRASDDALIWRRRFLDCVRDSASAHATADALATEISQGAVSQCQTPLAAYIGLQRIYHNNVVRIPETLEGVERQNRDAEEQARRDGTDLVTEALRMGIARILEQRTGAPPNR